MQTPSGDLPVLNERTTSLPEWSCWEERDWFERGVRQGWLRWSSICSAHSMTDPNCVRCAVGSYSLRAFDGRWATTLNGSSSA